MSDLGYDKTRDNDYSLTMKADTSGYRLFQCCIETHKGASQIIDNIVSFRQNHLVNTRHRFTDKKCSALTGLPATAEDEGAIAFACRLDGQGHHCVLNRIMKLLMCRRMDSPAGSA